MSCERLFPDGRPTPVEELLDADDFAVIQEEHDAVNPVDLKMLPECGFCRALRQLPWWYRLWLRIVYGIREEHPLV